MSEKQPFQLHNVEVIRGSDVITVAVPAHEIEVLRAVHGLEKVKDCGKADDTIDLSPSADEEYARLQRSYHRVNSPDPVAIACRSQGSAFLRQFGFEVGRGSGEAAPQSGVRNHKKRPEVDKPEGDAPKAAKAAK